MPNLLNPICVLLPAQLETGIAMLEKAVAYQNAIKRQVNAIIDITDLSNLLDQIPDPNFTLNTNYINEMLNACPGIFPNIPAVNANFSLGLKNYLNFLKGSPLGILDSYLQQLDTFMAPIKDTLNSLKNYLVCLQNICGYLEADFNTQMSKITNLESALNLDSNGKPQILSNVNQSIMNNYRSKMDAIKEQQAAFS